MDSKYSEILGEIFDDFKGLIIFGVIIVIFIILLYLFNNFVNFNCAHGGFC